MRAADKCNLKRHVIADRFPSHGWTPYIPDEASVSDDGGTITRSWSPRKLADVVEAILGACYLAGGVSHALRAGEAFGLCFGGLPPWSDRLPPASSWPVDASLRPLEIKLGYTFTDGRLLTRALTHRSASGASSSCAPRPPLRR